MHHHKKHLITHTILPLMVLFGLLAWIILKR
jgi:hypothetical protein